MLFNFTDPNTERIDFEVLLKDHEKLPQEYLKTLAESRSAMCDRLVAQPASQTLLESIESYLPHLLNLVEHLGKEVPRKMVFAWKGTLTKGVISSLKDKQSHKITFKSSSVYLEAIYVLLSYALTLCNLAAKRVGANPLQASEPLLNEAIDMYCRAAGVAQMLTSLWATRWACSPGKERPVETSMTGLQLFAEFCLLEAQLLAAQKAGKRGMSSPTLVKLYRGALEKFAAIKYLVDGDKYLSSELSDTFLDYVHDGNIAIEGMMLKRFAEHCHSQDKNGLAVACMTKAYNILTVDSRRLESPIWSKIVGAAVHGTEIKSTLEGIVRINNNVTYDRVPNENDMLKQLPSATLIVQSKEFALPIAAEILSKKEKDSQDKIFTTPAEPSVADDANKTL